MLAPPFSRPARPIAAPALLALVLVALARPAGAQSPSFVAELDREAVAPNDPFVYQVTLTVSNEEVDGYRPPDFKGLRVLSSPPYPSRSTQMQIGGGQTVVQNGYTWSYQLMVPPGGKGPLAIGPARARVAGRELRSNALTVRVDARAAGGAPAGRTGGRGLFPGDPFANFPPAAAQPQPPPAEAPLASTGAASFIRAVPDKPRAFVGEQVTVTWTLYLTQRQDKFETVTEPRTDGFWTEEIASTNPRGRLTFAQETIAGRPYQVAVLFKRALFPLRAGKLTITPLEAEVAQVDFFGTAVRTQRLKAAPLTIEAAPLPRDGQPAGFDPGNVGKYTLTARADRATVSVGQAVTLTVEIRGIGNLRNVRAPALPHLDGWKSYEPKVNVNLDPGEVIAGSKVIEVLLLPERAGTTIFPGLELVAFDPQANRYALLRSEPLRLDVTGEGAPAARSAPGGPAAGGGVENVIAAEIRPIRARTRLQRDVGVTFLRSRAFTGVLAAPPLALALAVLFGRLRERLTEESSRARRRRMRTLIRQRLGAAEGHRQAGRAAALYIEIDRVLREVLAARLGRSLSGLRMDELRDLLGARGMPGEDAARIVVELEACDQARFAPGDDAAGAAAMAATLERAGELIVAIEKAPLREETPA